MYKFYIIQSRVNYTRIGASQVAQWWRICLPVQERWVRSLGGEHQEEIATHSSILAWEIPWTEEPGGLQSVHAC